MHNTIFFTIEPIHFVIINDQNDKISLGQLAFAGAGATIPSGYRYHDIVRNNVEEIKNIINDFPEIEELSDDDTNNTNYYRLTIKNIRKFKILNLTDENKNPERFKKLEDLLYNKTLIRIWEGKPVFYAWSGNSGTSGTSGTSGLPIKGKKKKEKQIWGLTGISGTSGTCGNSSSSGSSINKTHNILIESIDSA